MTRSATLPILIHGDAAFAAQGVVAETFNMARLAGYSTGGTVHLIANNQVGFTTGPSEGRSTDYSSDLAKGFDVPIIHVNADDAEACLAAARLAMMYRDRFHADVVIDLVGYRRYGHNEGDEPAYTQPQMTAAIAAHPSVRELYAASLVEAGVLSAGGGRCDAATTVARPCRAPGSGPRRHERAAARPGRGGARRRGGRASRRPPCRREDAARLNEQLYSLAGGFTCNPKLAKQLETRRAALRRPRAAIEWAHAEALAFGSLVLEGTRSGSPARTPCAAPSASATWRC